MSNDKSSGSYSPEKQKEYRSRYFKKAKGKANSAWHHLLARARGDYEHRTKAYVGVEVRMTRDEFMAWAIPEFQKWIDTHPDDGKADNRPSVDRIRSEGHYEIGNIQIISHRENAKKVRNVNTNAPEGTKWCPACSQFVEASGFYKSNNKSAGPMKLSIHCKKCDDKRRRAARDKKKGVGPAPNPSEPT